MRYERGQHGRQWACGCVCEREGASECMQALVYYNMHAHVIYEIWVRAGVGVHMWVRCVRESLFVYSCVYVCMCVCIAAASRSILSVLYLYHTCLPEFVRRVLHTLYTQEQRTHMLHPRTKYIYTHIYV